MAGIAAPKALLYFVLYINTRLNTANRFWNYFPDSILPRSQYWQPHKQWVYLILIIIYSYCIWK